MEDDRYKTYYMLYQMWWGRYYDISLDNKAASKPSHWCW